jgi:[ribosomal protein S18]-alanine N-acetyltransferase
MAEATAIREMVNEDCASVAEIEAASFSDPWTREGFEVALGRSDIAAFVYAPGKKVLAYVILQLDGPEVHIMNLAVHPDFRRRGMAMECLRYAERFSRKRGSLRIDLEVQESNLPAQLLYRKAGYRATRILRNYYPTTHEDGYRMVRALLEPVKI